MKRIFAVLLALVLLSASCEEKQELWQDESTYVESTEPQTIEMKEFSFEDRIFRYGDNDYDVSERVPVYYIESAVPVGKKIVITCHNGPKNCAYCIFDTERESFDDDIFGCNLIWHDDDITTAVYSFWSAVYMYDGRVIKEYELTDGAFIRDLEFIDNYTKVNVTISYEDFDLTYTVDLPSE